MSDASLPAPTRTYSYLGPRGTFTERALAQVPEAVGQTWRPVQNLGEALDDVISGRSDAAMIAIENSIDGGVSVAQDALATVPGLRVIGEYLVPVSFDLVARRGTKLENIRVLNAHPVAYAQSRELLDVRLPGHGHIPAASNVAAAADLLETGHADAAVAPPGITDHYDLEVLLSDIGSNKNAVTRFLLVSTTRVIPARTGADKTSLIAELPGNESGALLTMLEQFSARGVNMSMIESRPVGDEMGRYRFIIDAEGHILDERMAEALLGLRRSLARLTFLGSYPAADRSAITVDPRFSDTVFLDAREWLRDILGADSRP
ncbi:prephenate dehydratase [Mycetocola tolaasinivorans]|uniref:Prephenate dehydratase n=1 Tax=Mycetocola tolaasinivorans TaxID=76635 RepID=A0A3L7A6M6_9MICO|nr:prephenate dehydratase [Mycetocola tolaasinivorans]RLP75538.1 prephenate dehydratase [Mycetocola tolaasinivorans]